MSYTWYSTVHTSNHLKLYVGCFLSTGFIYLKKYYEESTNGVLLGNRAVLGNKTVL
jgi:hypothetical protein